MIRLLPKFLRRWARRQRMERRAAQRRRNPIPLALPPDLDLTPKLRIRHPTVFDHHHSGFEYWVHALEQTVHHPGGVDLVTAVEDIPELDLRLPDPWVGVVHQPLDHDREWWDMRRVLASEAWARAAPTCRGLIVLADATRRDLEGLGLGVPVATVPLAARAPPHDHGGFRPATLDAPTLRLLHVGNWLREPQAFLDVEAPSYDKVLLHRPTTDLSTLRGLERAEVLSRVPAPRYEELLATSVVFLSLRNPTGCTTLTECLVRGTPVVVNDQPAVRELYGPDYPLAYPDRDLDQAAAFLADRGRLRAGHQHLAARAAAGVGSAEASVRALVESQLYRGLPDPEDPAA